VAGRGLGDTGESPPRVASAGTSTRTGGGGGGVAGRRLGDPGGGGTASAAVSHIGVGNPSSLLSKATAPRSIGSRLNVTFFAFFFEEGALWFESTVEIAGDDAVYIFSVLRYAVCLRGRPRLGLMSWGRCSSEASGVDTRGGASGIESLSESRA
jgi:hypothetical protein